MRAKGACILSGLNPGAADSPCFELTVHTWGDRKTAFQHSYIITLLAAMAVSRAVPSLIDATFGSKIALIKFSDTSLSKAIVCT